MIATLNPIPAATALPDPVALAIEAHRTAWAAIAKAFDDEEAASDQEGAAPGLAATSDAACRAEEAAWNALLATRPADADGLARLIRYIAETSRLEVLGDARDLGRNLAEAAEAVRSPIAAADPDPVFALIEEHQAAYAVWSPLATAWSETIGGSPEWDAAEAAQDGPGARETQAFEALLKARPTTAAGLWALTAYLPDVVRKVGFNADSTEQAALDALRDGALQLGFVPTVAGTCQDRPQARPAIDAGLIHWVQNLITTETEQEAILKAGDYADAYDAPDWVRLERHRETILKRVIVTRAHTMEGLKAKASLFDLESVRAHEQPSKDLSRSIVADVASINVAPSAEAHPDASLLALGLPFLAAWRDEGAADPVPDGECSEAQARCSALADRIAALPATTPEGLGIKALAFACFSGSPGSPASPMPEPDASSTASDDTLLWQIQAGAARILAGEAGAGKELPADAAAAPAEQPSDPTATALDLSGCSLSQLARLYEALRGVYEHLGAAGQRPCFRVGGHLLTRAGEILDEELDRIGAMLSDCADAVIARIPSSSDEREEALFVRVSHEMVANGCISDRALMRDLMQSWGDTGHAAMEASR
ncbi:hypothetical protein PUR29_36385 [Methylobacterium ajmalii]|uniref:Uncharacterized protein n=1 Tax=Methylobacterium ajmalii TaxID=2738439 RepID=A0ABV0A7I6_9HYPH